MNARATRDDGFTLVEVIVALALTSLVLTVIGGLFISVTKTQQTVDAVTSSTTSGQQAATTITDRVRNGSGFLLTNSGADQLVVARSAGTGSALTWTCYGWYYSASGKSIRMATTSPGTKITVPSAAQLAGWTLLVSGVSPRSGSQVFTSSGTQLSLAFNAQSGGHPPVAIQTSASPLTGTTEDHSCF